MNWKRLLFWGKLIIALSIFLPLAVFTFRFFQEIGVLADLIYPTMPRQTLSEGMELHKIELRGADLSNDLYIPSRYIVQISDNHDEGVRFVKLRLSYDELMKFGSELPATYPIALSDVRDRRDEVFIDIQNGHLTKGPWGDFTETDKSMQRESATLNGLYVYRQKNEHIGGMRILLPVEQPENDKIEISLLNVLTGNEQCWQNFIVDSRFSVEVYYDGSYLDKWRDVDKNARSLVRRFAEKPR